MCSKPRGTDNSLSLMSEFNNKKNKKNPNTEEHDSQLNCNFCISSQTCCLEPLLNGIHHEPLSCLVKLNNHAQFYMIQNEPDHSLS